jgi:DNA-binding MarR family transcriptional regulator
MFMVASLIEVALNQICGMHQSSAGPSFTDKQGQYLAFIDAYTRVHGRPPAETDLQRHFQVSPPSVHQMLLTLERVGLIRRQPGVARSIEVLVAPEHLPVLRHPQPVKSSGSRI